MSALVYRNTKTTLPGWVTTLHENQPRGIAYETATHFVHFYGMDAGLWVVSPGLTAVQPKQGTLRDWIMNAFGAQDIAQARTPIGHSVAGVWRPGITSYDDIRQGLGTTDAERYTHLQSIRLLIERLDDLFLYIEPSASGLQTYSHKTRELLILACTEVENNWKRYLRAAGVVPTGRDYTTNDYVRLQPKLFLSEYEVYIPPIRPFQGWDVAQPTQSLPWYHAYNLTKHDRQTYFAEATLANCLTAVGANIVMFSVRFSPVPLYHEGGTVSALFNQLFEISLRDCSPTTFYIRPLNASSVTNPNFICIDCVREKLGQPWVVDALTL
jgi:hypothetical protein